MRDEASVPLPDGKNVQVQTRSPLRQVRIETKPLKAGQVAMGRDLKISDAVSGVNLSCVARVSIPAFGADDIVSAEVEICSIALDVEVPAQFRIIHPTTGKLVTVASITLADGEVLTF